MAKMSYFILKLQFDVIEGYISSACMDESDEIENR